jgi:hypothetical protein
MSTPSTLSRRSSFIIGILIIVLGIGLIVYLASRDAQLHSGNSRLMDFSITSTSGSAIITLTDSTGQLSFNGISSTPWEKTGVYKNGDEVYLTAGNPSQFGTLVCSITINGQPWKTDHSDSPQDKVGCAGIIP